jgi:hypothetical protein
MFNEKAEVKRIAEKIKREGRRALTAREENILAYSPHGYAAGCTCAKGSIPIKETQN